MKFSIVRSFFCAVLLSFALPSFSWATQAQPVPIPEDSAFSPQLTLSGTGIISVIYGPNGQRRVSQAEIDYSDSSLQVGVATRLYNSSVGSAGFGVLTLDSDSAIGPFFLSQAFLDYQSEKIEIIIGRSDNPTAHLVDFPTLRDDDLYTLNNPQNPFSSGSVAQDHRYSNIIGITFNQGLSFYENIHAQKLMSTDESATNDVYSFGATFQYLSTPGLEAFARFPSAGIGAEYITPIEVASHGLYQIYGGGIMNLNESVTNRFDIRLLDIVSLGSNLQNFAHLQDTFAADSNAITAAIRFMHKPFGNGGYQLALTAGYKNYFKVSNAHTAGFALTGTFNLGEGFDLAIQYQGQWRDRALSAVQTASLAFEQAGQVGLIYNWDATFNRHISPRRTILNQFQYVPN